MNSEMDKFRGGIVGLLISHQSIAYRAPELFREDRVHLSDLGADTFLADIKEDISGCLGT